MGDFVGGLVDTQIMNEGLGVEVVRHSPLLHRRGLMHATLLPPT